MGANFASPFEVMFELMWERYQNMPRKMKKAAKPFIMALKEGASLDS